jgi:hypothetical protein
MKKIYLSIASISIAMASNAQLNSQFAVGSVKSVTSKNQSILLAKTTTAMATDTVGWSNTTDFTPQFAPSGSGNPTIFGSASGGYVYGKNVQLSTCAQGYYNSGSTSLVITKVVVWAGKKDMAVTPLATSNVSVSIWSMAANKARTYIAPTGTATAGTFTLDSYGPNVKLNPTALVNIANVDTSTAGSGIHWTVATFSTPVNINGDFAIVANSFGLASTDTVGFVSDAKNAAAGINMTFVATAGNSWYKVNGGAYADGSLDNNIAFFAVLGVGTAVKEYVNGVKLSALYPNPTKDEATITYSLEKNSTNVSLEVYTTTGQNVYSQTFGNQEAGNYNIKLDASNYASGSYFYQMRANGHTITKEFIVTK